MDIIEDIDDWRRRFSDWLQRIGNKSLDNIDGDYPFVRNRRSPFTPARRALPMLNLAVISSSGAYIDGTKPFDTEGIKGDLTYREIPIEVGAEDLRYSARGYDPVDVQQDMNSQIPIERLLEFERNGIIGQLNPVFWSIMGFIPDAAAVVDELAVELVARLSRYEVQAALLIPASPLCHQTMGLVARAIEADGIPTMVISVVKDITIDVHPPRAGYYNGKPGSVSGKPKFPEHQRRILDESLRLIEPMDQPGIRKLVVELESQVEAARGER
ncbi:MAG: hypothetical protein C5B55_06375 [Blastocatellia bacterium]|nr:MAG: hypothetical protein C5B55_06375 [Blastocatellia bacterium]